MSIKAALKLARTMLKEANKGGKNKNKFIITNEKEWGDKEPEGALVVILETKQLIV